MSSLLISFDDELLLLFVLALFIAAEVSLPLEGTATFSELVADELLLLLISSA
jgi:hypothetical protein